MPSPVWHKLEALTSALSRAHQMFASPGYHTLPPGLKCEVLLSSYQHDAPEVNCFCLHCQWNEPHMLTCYPASLVVLRVMRDPAAAQVKNGGILCARGRENLVIVPASAYSNM